MTAHDECNKEIAALRADRDALRAVITHFAQEWLGWAEAFHHGATHIRPIVSKAEFQILHNTLTKTNGGRT